MTRDLIYKADHEHHYQAGKKEDESHHVSPPIVSFLNLERQAERQTEMSRATAQ
jgi:hypothetical protein